MPLEGSKYGGDSGRDNDIDVGDDLLIGYDVDNDLKIRLMLQVMVIVGL